MKIVINILILFLVGCSLNNNHIERTALHYFNNEIINDKSLCIEDTTVFLDIRALNIRSRFEKYCQYGFLYDKKLYSNFVVEEYSLPYREIPTLDFSDNQVIDEFGHIIDLWDYYDKKKNDSFKISKILDEYSKIEDCRDCFENCTDNTCLIIKIRKPIKDKEIWYVQLDLLYNTRFMFMTIYILLDKNRKVVGWFFI